MNQEITILQNKVDLLTNQVVLLQTMITNLIKNEKQDEKKDKDKKQDKNVKQELAPYNITDKWVPYFNSRQPPKIFNDTINNVENCIMIATLNEGCVFGGYVRNVVVPRLKNKTSPGYKDVDFWFKTQQNADNFVKHMTNKLQKKKDNDKEFEMNAYLFVRQQYILECSYENIIIDIIISPTLPVNDFDVNQLTYSSNGLLSYGNKSIDELVSLIDSKTMNALPGFNGLLMDNKRRYQQGNRMNKLSQLGWKINVEGFRRENSIPVYYA